MKKKKEKAEDPEPDVGEEAVAIGKVGKVGRRGVAIGPTEPNGAVRLPSGAYGAHAFASGGGPAVGYGATTGNALDALVARIGTAIAASEDKKLRNALSKLLDEVRAPTPKPKRILVAWRGVEGLATVGGAVELAEQIRALLHLLRWI